MLSGLLPTKTGIFTNFQSLPSDRATFVHSLGIAGYETVLCGRMHFTGPDQRHGFMKRLVGDVTHSSVGGKIKMGSLDRTPDQSRIALEKSGPGNSSVIEYDREVFQEAGRYLEHRKSDKPLFMTVGLYGPHCPYVCPKDLFDYYYKNLPPSDTYEEFKKSVHPAVRKWYENRGISVVTEEEVRRSQAGYYGLVELMDRFIGRFLDTVDKTLGLKDTLLVYASDHGDMAGDKGLFWKSNFYEGSVRVPIIFSLPAEIQSGKRIEQITSLLDLGPTLIDLCGGLELPETDGESLLSLLRGEAVESRERTVISQLGDLKGDSPSAMIRKGEWKLVSHYGYDHPQLFNLEEDPEEMTDLGGEPQYQTKRTELIDELSRNWNGEQVLSHISISSLHTGLLKQWFEVAEPERKELWVGKAEDNYLLERD